MRRASDAAARTAKLVEELAEALFLDHECVTLLRSMEPHVQAAVINRGRGWGRIRQPNCTVTAASRRADRVIRSRLAAHGPTSHWLASQHSMGVS
eukprot:7824016-Alexandrium_andersonii.AAC.1